MNPEQRAQLQDQILAQLSLNLSQDKSPINQQILKTITNPQSAVYQSIQKTIQQTVNAATAETKQSLDAHVKASDAHAEAFALHNQDEKAHEKIQRNGLFSMFSADQLKALDNDQLKRALEDLQLVRQAYAAKSAQATNLLQERGEKTAGNMQGLLEAPGTQKK